MITPKNLQKNTITPINKTRQGIDTTWDEAIFTWDNAVGTWDNPFRPMINLVKNIITPINKTKN